MLYKDNGLVKTLGYWYNPFPEISDEGDKEVKHDCDPGTKSEGEEDSITGAVKKTLGRTPNHLTLSTTSTLSAGSTGSQAKLIQSSQHPVNYQPPIVKDLGKKDGTLLLKAFELHFSQICPIYKRLCIRK